MSCVHFEGPEAHNIDFPALQYKCCTLSHASECMSHTLMHSEAHGYYISLLSLSLPCIMLHCNRELYRYYYYYCTLLSAPPTLNNAAGHCAEAPTPSPSSRSSPYQQISARSAIVKSNYVQFSIYGANTINTISPFTQEQHQMFVFSPYSPRRMHIGGIALHYNGLPSFT